jgi:protein-disulfide isomerase
MGQFQRTWAWASNWSLVLALMLITPSVRAETLEPLAEVNGEAITAKDLEDALGMKLAKLKEQIYSLQSQKLDALITQRLLAQEAAKRGMTVAELLDAEVTDQVGLVTDAEVETFYQAGIREEIRASLKKQKLAAQRKLFLGSLRSNGQVQINLHPPPVIRVAVSIDGAPIRGMAEAPVTLVEFSDFHCPFCKRVQPTLEQVLERYPQKVKLVFRDFPLDKLHPQARGAAEAARCAKEQGKFWEYHDLLFTNAPKASSEDLETYAEKAGLEVKEFQSCLSDGGHQAAVQKDVEEGARLGITGTPMFFINGRPLSGALPLERFVQVIEEELARSAAAQKNADPKS